MRVRKTNCQLLLPGGATPEADRQPASTDRLERAGLVGVGNAHLFFIRGVHEPALRSVITLTHRKENGRMVILSTAAMRTYEVRDVDAWDNHTEILSVETEAFDADWETWERRRKVEVDSGSAAAPPEVQWVPEPVKIKFVSQTGSNFDDYGRERLSVIARRGTLQEGDILASEARNVNPEVWEVIPDGEYERAELRA